MSAIDNCINWIRASNSIYRRNAANEAAAELADLTIRAENYPVDRWDICLIHNRAYESTEGCLKCKLADRREQLGNLLYEARNMSLDHFTARERIIAKLDIYLSAEDIAELAPIVPVQEDAK